MKMCHLKAILTLTIAKLIAVAFAEQTCNTYPNYNTKAYTYTVCNGTDVIDLETSQIFCQDHAKGHVITFPNYEEYSFIVNTLNSTMGKDFRYVPGFYQIRKADKYNPETGHYFWVTDPNTRITNESKTYYQPFKDLIENFDNHESLHVMQTGTFVLNLEGKRYIGVSVVGGLSLTKVGGGVICVTEGVPATAEEVKQSTTEDPTQSASFQYWIVITVAAGVIVVGVVLALIAYCIFKRTKTKQQNMQKFHKVPQAESQHPQQYSV